MAAWPRIMTVDPSGEVGRIVRAALELMETPATFIDMPAGKEALDEIKHRPCDLLVTAVGLDDDIQGYQLAIQARKLAPNTGVVILADVEDAELDEETLAQSPFVYLRRPVDIHQFMRVMAAGMDGQDLFAALAPPSGGGGDAPAHMPDLGPVPAVDADAARIIVDTLLTDVGAMAVVLASRTGEVLLERGAVGYLDREQLARALLPMVATSIDMSGLVGGRSSTLQFYDGETYDVFVLSVGLHHFLCLIFDGQAGNRQFGAVNRFGRRAAEDLIALLGAVAYTIQKPSEREESRPRRKRSTQTVPQVAENGLEPIPRAAEMKPPEPKPLKLDPVQDFDPNIFDQLASLDVNAADDLFDPDRLGELANSARGKGGPIGFSEAIELGIMPDLDSK